MVHSPGLSLPFLYWHWWDTVVIGYLRYWMLPMSMWWLIRKKCGVCAILKYEMKISFVWMYKWPEIKWKLLHELSSFISETYEETCNPIVPIKAFTLKRFYVVNSQKCLCLLLFWNTLTKGLEPSKSVAHSSGSNLLLICIKFCKYTWCNTQYTFDNRKSFQQLFSLKVCILF